MSSRTPLSPCTRHSRFYHSATFTVIPATLSVIMTTPSVIPGSLSVIPHVVRDLLSHSVTPYSLRGLMGCRNKYGMTEKNDGITI